VHLDAAHFQENHMKTTLSLLAAVGTAAFGCASHQPPTDNLASAIAAVRGAQVAISDAGRVPKAALQLKLAEEEVAQARQMIERGDNERANYMTLRAYNDAELALALARQHQAQLGAEQASGAEAPSEPAPPAAPEPPATPPSAPMEP
jgi:hypothetical protein